MCSYCDLGYIPFQPAPSIHILTFNYQSRVWERSSTTHGRTYYDLENCGRRRAGNGTLAPAFLSVPPPGWSRVLSFPLFRQQFFRGSWLGSFRSSPRREREPWPAGKHACDWEKEEDEGKEQEEVDWEASKLTVGDQRGKCCQSDHISRARLKKIMRL